MLSSLPLSDRRKASPPAARPAAAWGRSAWAGLAGSLAIAGAYLLWLRFGRASAGTLQVVGDVMGPAGALGGFVWSVCALRRDELRAKGWRACLAPNLLSLSLLSYAVGEGLWAYYELALHRSPFPSLADVGYVGSMAFLLAGLVLSPSRPIPLDVRVRVVLDSLMTMAAVVTFSWYFALGPTVLAAEGSILAKSLTTAYPVMDLAMLLCVLVLSAHPFEKHTKSVRNLLCAGVLAYAAADVAFAYLSLRGEYRTCAVDVGWLLANLLVGQGIDRLRRAPVVVAAAPPVARPLAAARETALWRALLPYALVPAVLGLVYSVWRGRVEGPLANGVYLCAAALVALLMARQLFSILENRRLLRFLRTAYGELAELATTDGMTGLSNHRAFQERLRSDLEAARGSSEPVALLLIDVDRFKGYNDAFGHPAGDEALRIVARVLRESVRDTDLPARYGGEEFAVILPGTAFADACRVAERIRAATEEETFPHRAVTLSVGVACAKSDGAGALIEAADRALYAAKRGGRNRVVADGPAALDQAA